MARNKVEYHIQSGGFFTFKAEGPIEIGQVVELVGDREVAVAEAGSEKVVGVVYGGTVGKETFDTGDVVTVVVLKPFVYLTAAGPIASGDAIAAAADGKVATAENLAAKMGMAITSAAAEGDKIIAVIG
jgi:hypothetical protein